MDFKYLNYWIENIIRHIKKEFEKKEERQSKFDFNIPFSNLLLQDQVYRKTSTIFKLFITIRLVFTYIKYE